MRKTAIEHRKQYRKTWAVHPVNRVGNLDSQHFPCIYGALEDAEDGCDADEVVVQIEYRVLRQHPKSKALQGRERT